MYAEISPESIELIEKAMLFWGGKLKSVTFNRMCDNCKNENKEAFPYCVTDATGEEWNHLCNDCFDALGCSYVDTTELFNGEKSYAES